MDNQVVLGQSVDNQVVLGQSDCSWTIWLFLDNEVVLGQSGLISNKECKQISQQRRSNAKAKDFCIVEVEVEAVEIAALVVGAKK